MDTPITISSTLSSVGKCLKKITVPHSESSIARVPVSWDSPSKPYERESSCTPTTLQKVNNWINSIHRLNRDNVDSNSHSNRQSSDYSDFDLQNGLNIEGDLVNGLNNMPAYNKSDLKDEKEKDEFEHYCRSPYAFKNTKGSHSTLRTREETVCGGGPKKHFHPKTIKRRQSSQLYNLLGKDDDKSDEYDSDEPLSPESEKKKELCSYLQLMKPTDKKTVMTLQNRRSLRVKNLSIMHEKRELDKKIREANAEITNENDLSDNHMGVEQRHPGLKSFDEMNVDLDKKKYKWLQYSGTKHIERSFSFPEPANNLRDFISHFDDVREYWFDKCKEEAKIKRAIILKTPLKENREKTKIFGAVFKSNKYNDEVETNKTQENGIPECIQIKKKKAGTAKNKHNAAKTNGEVRKRMKNEQHKTIKGKMKLIDKEKAHKGNNVESKRREDIIKTIRKELAAKSCLDDSNFENSRLQTSTSTKEVNFLMPKPSPHLLHDIKDFEVVIKQNRDLKINSYLPSTSTNVNNTVDITTKILGSSESIAVPSSPSKLENKACAAEGNILDTSKARVLSAKKHSKSKRLNSERNVRRSSFKIKLKPRRRPLCKSEQILTRSKSPLISDIMRTLRSRSNETPSSELNSLINNMTRKRKKRVNKKENIKRKVAKPKNRESNIIPKHSDINMELSLKELLKDTNKDPVKSTNISNSPMSVIKDINYSIINADSNLPTSEKEYLNIITMTNLQNSMSDEDFCNLSTEHKTSLLIENTNEHNIPSDVPIIAIYNKNNNSEDVEVISKDQPKEKSEFYSLILNIEKYPEDDLDETRKPGGFVENVNLNDDNESAFGNTDNPTSVVESRIGEDSEIRSLRSIGKGCVTPVSSKEKSEINSDKTHNTRKVATPFISFKKNVGVKSLHKSLNNLTPKSGPTNLEVENSPTSWPSDSCSHKRKKSEHSINIFKEHGAVLKAFYLEYNLILCQEFMVSFWTQTALGNVLGAQNMWIYKGRVQRMAMNNNCTFKESLEMVVSTDNTVAYIELWTKEHQSDKREGPVADVFATVYFWKKGQNGLDKKVLQLENINGFADDVQYCVLKSTPKIVVSWHLACNELESKKTFIHCYQLAADYQAVCNISEFESVEHYVSSLHNIEGCDNLIMGCGENKITLWNLDYGYVVATIGMSEIKSPLSTLWVKCDRGFLFTLQQCVDRELRLIAIHGMNHTWKKLASYVPPDDYDRLKGVCVENGIVLAFYDQGILCWNAQSAETVLEESHNEAEYISGKYVISVVNDQVNIRHAITHLLSAEDL